MAGSQGGEAWPNVLVFILCFLSPPLGLLLWVLGNSRQRPFYLRSLWVRTGLVLLVLGSAPLVAIIIAAEIGLWPDPNPNPIGPGLLFFFSAIIATVCLAVGAIKVWLEVRRPAAPA